MFGQNNVTLAGESAGAVYCHAHLVMGGSFRQVVLQSGSLYLSPPAPGNAAKAIADTIEAHLKKIGSTTLKAAPIADLLKAQADLGIVSLFLQMEPELENFQTSLGSAERLLVGDCEFEVIDLPSNPLVPSTRLTCPSLISYGMESKQRQQIPSAVVSTCWRMRAQD